MEGMQQLISQTILDIVLATLVLLGAFGAAAIRRLAAKLKIEAQALENEEQRNLLIAALIDLEDIATKTVAQIEQTTAKALREAVKNGTRDRAELEALSKQAFNEISAAIRPEAKKLIEQNFGSFSNYLTKTIEAKVFELKNGQGAG